MSLWEGAVPGMSQYPKPRLRTPDPGHDSYEASSSQGEWSANYDPCAKYGPLPTALKLRMRLCFLMIEKSKRKIIFCDMCKLYEIQF